MPVTSLRCAASRRPQCAKWVKMSTRSPAANTDSTISSRRVSLPDRPVERLAVVEVRGGVVADLLERRDRGQDRSLARRRQRVGRLREQVVEHRLVEPDLLGGHRAVVELVDLVGELGGDLGLALGAAEQQEPVERTQCRLAVAAELGDERRSRADETGVGEVEDRPQVADAVLDRRAGQRQPCAGGDPAQRLRGFARRVLDRLRLVEHHRRPRPRRPGRRRRAPRWRRW